MDGTGRESTGIDERRERKRKRKRREEEEKEKEREEKRRRGKGKEGHKKERKKERKKKVANELGYNVTLRKRFDEKQATATANGGLEKKTTQNTTKNTKREHPKNAKTPETPNSGRRPRTTTTTHHHPPPQNEAQNEAQHTQRTQRQPNNPKPGLSQNQNGSQALPKNDHPRVS
jgi:hypothetical protein